MRIKRGNIALSEFVDIMDDVLADCVVNMKMKVININHDDMVFNIDGEGLIDASFEAENELFIFAVSYRYNSSETIPAVGDDVSLEIDIIYFTPMCERKNKTRIHCKPNNVRVLR